MPHTHSLVLLQHLQQKLERGFQTLEQALHESPRVVSMRSTSGLENLLYVRFLSHTRTSRLKAQQRQRNQGKSVRL